MSPPKQKAIGILGMHRSGTSAVTRAINLLGPYLGLQERLMPPVEGNNPDGFWEHIEIRSFHDRLLDTLSRAWDSSSPMPRDWWTRANIKPYRKELTDFIAREFSGQPVWLWKDPRSSLLLPLWQESLRELDIDVFYVLCLRNPLDVAESLKRRDGFSRNKSLNLWLLYNASACYWTNKAKRVVVCYDHLLAGWEESLRKVSTAFDLPWPHDDQTLRKAMADFIKLSSRHSFSNFELLLNDKSVPEDVVSLYRLLLGCEKDPGFLESNEFEENTSKLFSSYQPRTYRTPLGSAPKVSVVVPSYNHGKYIAEALESVLSQTHQDFEIVITDDGSVDNSVQEIQKFKDPRIRLFCHEKNQGQFVAMRKCIEEAKGEYIAVLNSDDAFLPDKLEKQVECLDGHPDVAAVFTYAALIDGEGNDFTDKTHFYCNIFKQLNRKRHEWLNYFFFKGNCLCHPSVVIGSECHKTIGHYEERFGLLADLDFWVRLCFKKDIYIIPENLVKFRIRKEQPSAMTLESRIRDAYEFSRILEHYLHIDSINELTTIFEGFPFPGEPLRDDFIPFYVAVLALEVNAPYHQLFGLNTLFRLLQDEKTAGLLNDNFGFGFKDFIRLTGKYDIFDIARIMEAEALRQKEETSFQGSRLDESLRDLMPIHGEARELHPSKTRFKENRKTEFVPLRLKTIEKLTFSLFSTPRVSIAIPVWNNWQYTYRCLKSILENTDGVAYEVIIIDNGSTDGTIEMLKTVENVKTVRNGSNLGYIKACNQGAEVTNGEYLLFLNNDTEPQKGWLRNLLLVAEGDKLIGAVGAKLVYPDGKLQEAGGMIFSDGRGWNFGNGDDPEKEIYNQIFEVDYCSGACLLVRKSLFSSLGGFDEHYSPAYYEEADLCFGMRRSGYKVLYNPKAVVIHHESVTAGKDTSSDFRKYLEINRKKFAEKWEDALTEQDEHPNRTGEPPSTASRERLARHRPAQEGAATFFEPVKKRGLIFFPQNPYPAKTGAHKRCLAVLRALKEIGYDVTLFSYKLAGCYPWTEGSIRYLRGEMGIDVSVYEDSEVDRRFIASAGSTPSGVVNWNVFTPPGLVEAFRRLFIKVRPDITIVNYAYWAGLAQEGEFNSALKVIDTLDLVTLVTRMWQVAGEYLKDPPFSHEKVDPSFLEEDFYRKRDLDATLDEYQIYDQFDYTIAVSSLEARAIRENTLYTRVVTIPITSPVVDVNNSYEGPPVFVMGDNPVNLQGYLFLAAKVMPGIENRLPSLKVNVAGEATHKLLPARGVQLLGYIPDLTPVYTDSMFALCPVMGGTGMQVKIIEAMAHGLPVIALRSTGQEIPIKHGETGFIAENGAEFADYILRLHSDRALCRKMGQAARESIGKHFSGRLLSEKLSEITLGRPNIFRPKLTETIQVGDLSKKLQESEADRAARLEVINSLGERLQASEADRAARLEVINSLGERLQASEADRAARLEVINSLIERLQACEADRAARLEVINSLSLNLQASEADRGAKLDVLERQGKEFSEKIAELKSSMSWRVTAPFRWALDKWNNIKG